jgi:MFS family permease
MIYADFIDSVNQGFDTFWEWLPRVLGAAAVLLATWLIALLLARLTRRLLHRVGLDRLAAERGPDYVKRAAPNLSSLLSGLVFWLIMLGGFGIAANVLGVTGVEDAVDAIWAYIPNVLAAVAILVIAGFVAPWAGRLISAALPGRPLGSLLGTAAVVLILSVAVFMALDQLEIAANIVMITYASLIGSVALGMALAFGLGGRDAASDAIRSAREHGSRLAQPSASPEPQSVAPGGETAPSDEP